MPILERVRHIDDLGFEVEIWDWTRHDIDDLQATGRSRWWPQSIALICG
jgi:hydroxypyruvate isomerase